MTTGPGPDPPRCQWPSAMSSWRADFAPLSQEESRQNLGTVLVVHLGRAAGDWQVEAGTLLSILRYLLGPEVNSAEAEKLWPGAKCSLKSSPGSG